MERIQFQIIGRNAGSRDMHLFYWTRDATSGIERAKRDAKEFGYSFEEIFAVPVLTDDAPLT